MYQSVDEALRVAYGVIGKRIEPQNNTEATCAWVKNKGVSLGRGELTQHEKHADAVMTVAKVEKALNRFELAVVECHYGHTGKLTELVMLMSARGVINNDQLNLCVDIITNICFPKTFRMTKVLDRNSNISESQVFRKKKEIKRVFNEVFNRSIIKLETVFFNTEITYKSLT